MAIDKDVEQITHVINYLTELAKDKSTITDGLVRENNALSRELQMLKQQYEAASDNWATDERLYRKRTDELEEDLTRVANKYKAECEEHALLKDKYRELEGKLSLEQGFNDQQEGIDKYILDCIDQNKQDMEAITAAQRVIRMRANAITLRHKLMYRSVNDGVVTKEK